MAIVFAKPRRKETYPLIILAILLVVFIVILVSIFRKTPTIIPIEPEIVQPPQIKFSNLEHPILQRLEPYEFLEGFQDEIGRDNPFLFFLATSTLTQ